MYGKLYSACIYGIDGMMIEVEVDIANGIPQTNLVGLPDSAVREAIERVRAAIKNCGFSYPLQRVTINLAPADVRKEGSSFDLAIALSLLVASGQITLPSQERLLIIGELSLDGALRPVSGILSMVDLARRSGFHAVLVPADNAEEASLLDGITVYGITHLRDLHSTNQTANEPIVKVELQALEYHKSQGVQLQTPPSISYLEDTNVDYCDVLGQQHIKRALTIAAAGMHNIVLIGPPGTGKTMLIRRLPSILPKLSPSESLEVTKIYSSAGKLKQSKAGLITQRPFRSPHHSISSGGLIGGGSIPKPGEVSLSHHGVLFLDELPEFSRNVLETLRQPLEEGVISISRSRASFTFPANFLLAASLNPCPCGFYGSDPAQARPCTCSAYRIAQYRERISGPLLDRIDMHVEVPRPSITQQSSRPLSSKEMREDVERAVAIQLHRFEGYSYTRNSQLSGSALRKFARMSPEATSMLNSSFEALSLSMRAYDRIIKLSRTIADLSECEMITPVHIAEAIQYRQLDRDQELMDTRSDYI